ncbi:uncharacterized protein LOC111108986 [Crassostrea virginica]
MARPRWLDLAGCVAVGCSAHLSGAAWYIGLVHVPTLMEAKHDTQTLLNEWKLCYRSSRYYQGTLAVIGSSAAAVMFYMKEGGMNRWVWLAGGGVTVLTVWPSALLFMGRDINKKLNEENVIMTEGDNWVKEKITVWNKRHAFRSILASFAAFGLLTVAFYRTKMA